MNHSRLSLLGFLFTALLFSCSNQNTNMPAETGISIIPLPKQVKEAGTYFTLKKNAAISLPEEGAGWQNAVNYLNDQLEMATGQQLKVQTGGEAAILFKTDPQIENGEAYRLSVNTDQIEIAAKTAQGAFYGVQSLLQLMPPEIFSTQKSLSFPIQVQGVQIEDAPRFPYRGMHLDVGRHFFDVEEIKEFIDLMAMHKYNTFHWHLTEDQGWRIEIKQYPKLTEVGAFRKETVVGHASVKPAQYDGKPYGGFYTQEEVKEVIAYAQERFVTIVPEIELPGHAQAAIAAYPELGCMDEKLEVLTTWGVSDNVFCPTEETFTFLENVLKEVMDLFPGEYFHIGGDECPKVQWEESAFCQNLMKKEGLKNEFELQSYFIRRIEKILNAGGKRLIGWDEILEGGLAPNATVMSWRGIKGGIEAANEGHDVIMTPTAYCYFDYYQSLHPDEPLAIGGFLPLEKVYSYDPVPEELPEDKRHHIIGVQANLWTEYVPTFEHLQYMVYPRGAAMAEVAWSDQAQRTFDDFAQRLTRHFKRYEARGVNAAQSFFEVNGKVLSEQGAVSVSLESRYPGATIYYTLDGSDPTPQSTVYAGPIAITKTSEIKATSFAGDVQKGKVWRGFVNLHKAVGKGVSLSEKPAERYGKGGKDIIINGIFGSETQFSDQEWLGFEGKDVEAIIDLGAATDVKEVKCRFFKSNGSWVYLPKKVSIFTSTDGENYELAGSTDDIAAEKNIATSVVSFDTKATYLKVVVERYGIIPEGYAGAGYEAWLFMGEVEVN